MCRGTVPNAYQTKPVIPAQNAAILKSRKYDMTRDVPLQAMIGTKLSELR